MGTIVTALIYSGLQNLSWELTGEQESQLKTFLQEKREITFELSALSVGILGYKGFLIQPIENRPFEKNIVCFDGIIDVEEQTQPNFVDRDSVLEYFLLGTANSLSSAEKKYIESEISKNVQAGPASISRNFQSNADMMLVPPFDPGKWNIPTVQPFNNCYNYANDKITNTFAQPGRGSGSIFASLICGNVSPAAQRDGQVPVASVDATPADGHFIALVVAPGIDYHWYRLDLNGMWSHKPGQTSARNYDNDGRPITDPRTCSRAPYSDFCGFFHCIPARTTIR